MDTRKIRYRIECSGILEFADEVTFTIDDPDYDPSDFDSIEEFEELALNYKNSSRLDELWEQVSLDCDIIIDAVQEYAPETKGVFSVSEVQDALYRVAHEYIDSLKDKIKLIAYKLPDAGICADDYTPGDGEIIRLDASLLLHYFHEALHNREWCEQAECDAGGTIERSLELFAEESSWHAGYISSNNSSKEKVIPALWFGMEDQPSASLWTLSEETTEEELAFWNLNDWWNELAAIIGDDDDGFLTWYIFECGRGGPDINEIREKCPIKVLKSDTLESISKKIQDYFATNKITEQ